LGQMDFLCTGARSRFVIRIPQHPPPGNFNALVRRRGRRFLSRNPQPTAAEFSRHDYWKKVHGNLYSLYHGICAYCAQWTPRLASPRFNYTSIDHFIPKSCEPWLAYEWSNLRLCRARLNLKKGDSLDVVDPLFVADGWFIIDFLTYLIKSNPSAPVWVRWRVERTITRLDLNSNDYVDERINIIRLYVLGRINLSQLHEKYPFIAAEVIRQDFDRRFKQRLRSFFSGH
jgi:hypothetical protein